MTMQRQNSLNPIVFSYRNWKIIYRQILAHINSLTSQHQEDQANIKEWVVRLKKINRLMMDWADKNENAAAATRLASVTKIVDRLTDLSKFMQVTQRMNDEQAFRKFLEAAQDALQRPNAGVLGTLPENVLSKKISRDLSSSDIRSLRMTCRFFQGHENLKNIMNKKFLGYGSMIRGKNHSVILLPDRRVFVSGVQWDELRYIQARKARKSRDTWMSLALPNEAKGVPVKQIAGGDYHTPLILLEDGRVFECSFGQLGLRNRIDRHTLTLFSLPEKEMLVEQIAGGDSGKLILLRDGGVLVYKVSYGNGTATLTPLPLPEKALVKKILTRGIYMLILLRDGGVLVYKVSYGNGTATLTPLPLPEKEVSVEQIIVGYHPMIIVILLNDGRVFVSDMVEVFDIGRSWMPLTLPKGASVKQLLNEGDIALILLDDNRMLDFEFESESNKYILKPYKSILRKEAEAIAEQEDGKKCVLQ